MTDRSAGRPRRPPGRAGGQEHRRRLLASIGVFLDVDGTLLNLQDCPQVVRAPGSLVDLLRELLAELGGALALVSGRRIEDLDRVFAPLRLPAAGLHGLQRRDASGAYPRDPQPAGAALAPAREAMRQVCRRGEGMLLEDKGASLALHFRRAPQCAAYAAREMQAIAAAAGTGYELLAGKDMIELRPAGVSKGTAVAEFLREQPFLGRAPIYLGDDLTDEPAFEQVNRAGGLSVAVAVGRPTAAKLRLPSPAAVQRWLQALCATPAAVLGRVASSESHGE
jgi:trehalose 6-phosphate phosphatase